MPMPPRVQARLPCESAHGSSAWPRAHCERAWRRAWLKGVQGLRAGQAGLGAQGLQWGADAKYTKAIGALKHYTMYSWSAGDSVDPIPFVRGEGVWLWDAAGKRYLDWNSQAMSVHIGHGNKKVIAAIQKQAAELA